jgi:Mrp family chromosome partitioning ATPase
MKTLLPTITQPQQPPPPPPTQGTLPPNQQPPRPPLQGTPLPPNQANNATPYTVTNPTTNAKLSVQVFSPQDAGKKYPALVLVPGGTGDSSGFINDATQMANAGIVAVIFDPDGRGKSTGQAFKTFIPGKDR